MESESGLAKAGPILLLVGAILAALGAVMLLFLTIGLGVLFASVGEGYEPAFITAMYGGMALLLGVGSVFGFVAYNKARAGDFQGAFVFGLVCSLVPPVQVVPLLGAIFCKVAADE